MEYISTNDERAAEIEKTFSYDGYQIVRREMFAHLREPAITIRRENIAFNKACIDGIEDAVFIQIMISEDEKRIAIRKCDENAKDAIRWCVAKPDKRSSRNIKGRFSDAIYKLMEWDAGCRYKVLGHRIEFQGETLYVFELEQCEIFKERPKRTKAEKEERAQSMSPDELKEADQKEIRESRVAYYPDDAENTFGLPVEEHQDTIKLETMNQYSWVTTEKTL